MAKISDIDLSSDLIYRDVFDQKSQIELDYGQKCEKCGKTLYLNAVFGLCDTCNHQLSTEITNTKYKKLLS